jgi:hypothetical protein
MDGSYERRAPAATVTCFVKACLAGLAGLAGLALPAASQAEGLPGFVPRTSGPQFMLYVSHALGTHGTSANRIGLRYENATPASSDPAFRFCAPMRHRALVDLQFAAGRSPRMLFGENAAWDIGRRQLGPTDLASAAYPVWTVPLAGNTRMARVP